jgi:hypothetical protein
MKLRIVLAGLIFGSVALAVETGAELFQKALTAERAAGNLEEAIKLYQRIAKDFASDRALAAKALVQEARCYEKLGKDNAVRIYQQVAREYKDQPEPSAAANARLAALKLGDGAAGPVGMTQRKIELPFPDRSTTSDGRRLYSWDSSAGRLLVSDLAGKGERTIFKLKAGDRMPSGGFSRDFSMTFALVRRTGELKVAVFKNDGTGYREFNSVSPSDDCDPDFSWDNRYLFLCASDQDGTQQLVRVSLGDGEVRKLRANDSQRNRPSPDGRFIALSTQISSPGKVLVVPTEGGEPHMVSDNAHLIDWTLDGRYLIVDGVQQGREALYLVPLKDGRLAGDPIFLNYGACAWGMTTSAGALICENNLPGGGYQTWLGTLDSRGHPVDWKRLDTGGTPAGIRWSPDSAQISYNVNDVANKTSAVRLRNIASGEEREVYRGTKSLRCIWAAQRPALLCGEGGGGQLSSISLDSGRLEPLGAFAGKLGYLFFTGDDDRTIYLGSQLTLFRWDAGTQQSTLVERIPLAGRPDPNKHWLARREGDKFEIRPTAGGDWKPLVSVGETQMVFTPDGNWLLYHDVDGAGKHGLFRVPTTGGPPERVGDFPSVPKAAYGYLYISPDGQKFIAQGANPVELLILENFEPKRTAAR